MVFITAGMGGGTGTGASPVVASVARELGALTVAIVTKPFFYEGRKRAINTDIGMKELRDCVDAIIVVPNDRIGLVVEKGTPMLKSFAVANDVLRQAVQGISDLILIPGLINLDFADVKAVMVDAGRAVMGIGLGRETEERLKQRERLFQILCSKILQLKAQKELSSILQEALICRRVLFRMLPDLSMTLQIMRQI